MAELKNDLMCIKEAGGQDVRCGKCGCHGFFIACLPGEEVVTEQTVQCSHCKTLFRISDSWQVSLVAEAQGS